MFVWFKVVVFVVFITIFMVFVCFVLVYLVLYWVLRWETTVEDVDVSSLF